MHDERLRKMVDDHEHRILALESLLEDEKSKPTQKEVSASKDYSGPKGGALLLISKGFFNTKKSADEVCSELTKEGYVYKRVVVQTALRRLSNTKGPLVKIDETGKQAYVQRK